VGTHRTACRHTSTNSRHRAGSALRVGQGLQTRSRSGRTGFQALIGWQRSGNPPNRTSADARPCEAVKFRRLDGQVGQADLSRARARKGQRERSGTATGLTASKGVRRRERRPVAVKGTTGRDDVAAQSRRG
jgi:hypothetical protein